MTTEGLSALPDAQRVLVVDDDVELCGLLQRYLQENGYTVRCVGDGKAMEQYLGEQAVDLIVLDLMLPGEDGLSLAQRLRQGSDVPVIMLSARGEDVDRIVGLEMGADDYMAKPFNPRELLARIKALLRRSAVPTTGAEKPRGYSFAHYYLDFVQQQFFSHGEPVALTSGEFSLLRVLVENPEQELNRDELVQRVKGYERQPYDRSIDICITRLRKKIEADPSNPCFIRTVWGKGYLFTPMGDQR